MSLSNVVILAASLAISPQEVDRIAAAIYVIEGGTKTSYPFGVKCHRHTYKDAERICKNTIRNTHERWLKSKDSRVFLDYLADRYCPPSVDPVGNRRWKQNIKRHKL